MKDQLEQVIKDAACGFADRRTCLFEVRVDSVDVNRAVLSGRVLDSTHLDALRRAIAEKLPALRLDDSAVRVLRTGAPPVVRTVATNLTDLHRELSFHSELMTQVLNGRRLEVLEERDRWCFVRQPEDGYLGWAYTSYLTDQPPLEPTHLIARETALFHEPGDPAKPVHVATRLLAATPVRVVETREHLVRVQPCGLGMLPGGWTGRQFLRELSRLPLPLAQARHSLIADARALTGVYYLWGGCTAFGIDCSGLCQLVHRLVGCEIPRDADMQFAAGRVVDGPPFQPGDLLFFAGEQGASDKRKVTHVGLATGERWGMIHASRSRNGVYEDDVQSVDHLRTTYAGARTFLG